MKIKARRIPNCLAMAVILVTLAFVSQRMSEKAQLKEALRQMEAMQKEISRQRTEFVALAETYAERREEETKSLHLIGEQLNAYKKNLPPCSLDRDSLRLLNEAIYYSKPTASP